MKKFLAIVLSIVLMFSVSGVAMGKDFSGEFDGRNGNSYKNGSFDLAITDGPYYVGDSVVVTVSNIVIDGPGIPVVAGD